MTTFGNLKNWLRFSKMAAARKSEELDKQTYEATKNWSIHMAVMRALATARVPKSVSGL